LTGTVPSPRAKSKTAGYWSGIGDLPFLSLALEESLSHP